MNRRVKASLISIGADIALISIKWGLAVLTGSAALLADAYHSLSDLFISSSILSSSLLRSRMAKKKAARQAAAEASEQPVEIPLASEEEPGAWIDTAIAYGVSIVVLCLPLTIASEISRRTPIETRYLWIAVVGLMLCIAIAHFLSRFKVIAGKETDSAALVADGYHSRTDMFTSIAVLFSLIGSAAGIDIDGIVAVIIAALIAVTGLDLLVTTIIGDITKRDMRRFSLWVWGVERAGRWFSALIRFLTRGRFDPADLARRWRFSLRSLFSWKVAAVLVALAAAGYLLSGLRMIAPGEEGVRIRFGRVIDAAMEPGIVWLLPAPFERLDRARPRDVRRVEVGFRTAPDLKTGGFPLIWDATHTIKGYSKKQEESLTVTGDENLVDIALTLQYRPADTLVAGYRVRALDEVMRGLLESAMRSIMATEKSEELLGADRLRSLNAVRDRVERDARDMGLGIEVLSVLYHDLHPPVEVVPAFRAVFSAREEKIRAVNDAQSHANGELPKARAAAVTETVGAEAQAAERVARAAGDAARFSRTAAAFGGAPGVASYRLYIETMEEGLAGKEKIVADPAVAPGDYRLWHFAPEKMKQGK